MYRQEKSKGMAIVMVQGWKCEYEDCGHVWIKTKEDPPDLCGKCRRRRWNETVEWATKRYLNVIQEDMEKEPSAVLGEVRASREVVTEREVVTPKKREDVTVPREVVTAMKSCSECGGLNGVHQKGCKKR